MGRLKAAIIREYEDDPEVRIEVYNPRNTVAVDLHFRGEKTAKVNSLLEVLIDLVLSFYFISLKVVGRLAMEPPKEGQVISGILVKRNFNYHLMDPADLSAYTELNNSVLTQRQSVFYSGSLALLQFYLHQLAGEVENLETNDPKKKSLRVFKQITLNYEPPVVILEVKKILITGDLNSKDSFLFLVVGQSCE